jgi:hypothetical protein
MASPSDEIAIGKSKKMRGETTWERVVNTYETP